MFTSILFLLLIRGTVNSTTPPNCEGHSEGESWVSQPCEFCSCKSGNKICSSPDCHVPCDDPVPGDGACCPTCPGDTQQTSYRPWQCLVCPPGSPGPRGMPGQQGVPGRDGRDGRDQPTGCPGSNTPTEEPPITDGEDQTGVTYVHWGKDSCPAHSLLVYQGVVGGKQYTQKGSGTNYLCLHSSPTYLRPRAGRRSFAAYIYGTEMESGGYAEGFPDLHLESEVACSVCLARSKRNVLMIPGVHSCPVGQGWTEEYHGYLMANHHGYYATEFICVDHEAEGIPNTGHDNDPALLYIAEGVCSGHGGGLPCPPYVDGHELTCVVCSL